MKCRYSHCKLGGEVEKEDAIKDNNAYYHKECYKKREVKVELRDFLKEKGMVHRDINITLKKAIDEISYDVEYVNYIVKTKWNEIKTAYNLLYHLKIEDNYRKYERLELEKKRIEINKQIKEQKIENKEITFTYKKSKSKRFKIY